MRHKFKKRLIKTFGTVIFIIVSIFICDKLFPLPEMPDYSKCIYSENAVMLNAYLSSDDKWRLRTRLCDVTSDLKKALIEKEDKWFYRHPGVNPAAVLRALISNISGGQRVSGASTITMQTIKLLEPAPRTYFSKIREMFRAFQLELHYSKDEILEQYMSLLPYGGNIEGVKSAAYIYFNRPPEKLSLAQCILLAAIPNNPNFLRPDIKFADAKTAQLKLIRMYKKNNVFSETALRDAGEEQLFISRHAMPNAAPHFCIEMKNSTDDDIIYTCIDKSIQTKSEKLLKYHVNNLKSRNINNGAVIVIDNKTSSVRAYCGSADFFDIESFGQVNGVKAIRSPGSTLKAPLFTYAIDLGLITPKSKLKDIPTEFTGYAPENYDSRFNGLVTVDFALKHSLNIPAVRILQEVGINKFTDILERCGLSDIKKRKESLGLSLILGGCGASPEELAKLYTVLARKGKLFDLRYRSDREPDSSGITIFSEDAAYICSQILISNDRPDFSSEMAALTDLPMIAWKTGTSYGRRDAWAVGYNPNYTIVVWLGNFDGTGSPYLSGAEAAVPLLFRLFSTIDHNADNRYFEIPENTDTREICAETGHLPSANCKNITTDYYILNKSSDKICDLYKKIYINADSSIMYCPECLPDSGYREAMFPVYDPDLTLWYLKNNFEFAQLPAHNPKCTAVKSDDKPQIKSPSPDYQYLVEVGSDREILLQAAPCSGTNEHYWYIDDEYYGKCKPEEKIFFKPEKKELKITCTDDKGRSSSVIINVQFI